MIDLNKAADTFESWECETIQNTIEKHLGNVFTIRAVPDNEMNPSENYSVQLLQTLVNDIICDISDIIDRRLREMEFSPSLESNEDVCSFVVVHGNKLWYFACDKIEEKRIRIESDRGIAVDFLSLIRDSYLLSFIIRDDSLQHDSFYEKTTRKYAINILIDKYSSFVAVCKDRGITQKPEPTPVQKQQPTTIGSSKNLETGAELLDLMNTMSKLKTFVVDGDYGDENVEEKLRLHNHLLDILNNIMDEYPDEDE